MFRHPLLSTCLLMLSITGLSAPFASADAILMKDGTRKTGTIVDRDKSVNVLLSRTFVGIAMPDTVQKADASGTDSSDALAIPDSSGQDTTVTDSLNETGGNSQRSRTKPASVPAPVAKSAPAEIAPSSMVVPVPVASIQYLIITNDGKHQIIDVPAFLASASSPSTARFLIGANLDFLDGVQATNVYYFLSQVAPTAFYSDRTTLFPIKPPPPAGSKQRRSTLKRIASIILPSGYSFGFEQGRVASRDTTDRPIVTIVGSRDSIRSISVKPGKATEFLQTDFTDLSFALYWPLWRGADDSFNVLALLLSDFRRTKISERTDILVSDSVAVGSPRRTDEREVAVSVGVSAYVDLSDVATRWTFTLSNHNSEGIKTYLVQAALREKKFGLVVGGEVRGFGIISRNKNRRFPEFQVYLGKSFALDKLTDFLTGS